MTEKNHGLYLAGHRGMGCTDHDFYQTLRDIKNIPVENTLPAIDMAFDKGAAYVEIDAVMSKDTVVFILHNVVPEDHFFGDKKPQDFLNHLSFSEIKNYKTGRFQTGEVTLLADALGLIYQKSPKILSWDVNIEIKGVQGSDQNYESNNFIEKLAAVIDASPIDNDRILLSSFCLENIVRMSHHIPEAHYGMLFVEPQNTRRPIYKNFTDNKAFEYLTFEEDNIKSVLDYWQKNAHERAAINYFHPEVSTVTADLITLAKSYNKDLNCWGLFEEFAYDKKNHYRGLLQSCVQYDVSLSMITDYLDEMRGLDL